VVDIQMVDEVETWPLMIWIGGMQGAGKSTAAVRLAHAYDLPVHRIDLWTYDHVARLPTASTLDEELSWGPHAAAAAFEATGRARIPLVVADVLARELGGVAAVVEGPQLHPDAAGAQRPGWSVWLLTDGTQTRRARDQRAALLPPDAAARSRIEALTERDEVLAARLRRALTDAALPVIEVPSTPDWAAITDEIEACLTSALQQTPRLTAGRELTRQRRLENLAAVRQGRLWQQAEGISALPPFRFACECGRSGCCAGWFGTPDDFDSAAATGYVRADEGDHP
jgi:hypothetical protein